MLEFRAYMNEGGEVFYTGNWAGQQYTGNVGNQFYDPKGEGPCTAESGVRPAPLPAAARLRRRHQRRAPVLLRRLPGGARRRASTRTGTRSTSTASTIPFEGLTWGLNGGDSADNQDATSSFIATSGILPPDEYPQFESWPSSRWDKPGGPFDPHTGEQYMYSQIADVAYKRLTREVVVPAGGGDLTFWTSYDTEADWDFVFVEARTPGGDDWTTLPDANGHTSQATGESCPAGWRELHPHLEHYQTFERATARARRRARPASGTPPRATRTAGRSGRSTSPTTPVRPSRSRSPTSATGRPRTSACSSTT